MAKVSVSFAVRGVEIVGGYVMLTLQNASEAATAYYHIQRPNSTEEEMGRKVVMGGLEVLKQIAPPPNSIPRLALTLQQYEQLGRPTVSDMITAHLEASPSA